MLAVAVAATLTPGLLLPPGGPGGPAVAHAAACSGRGGVSVVVDLGAFGGPVTTRCASGAQASAADALAATGHTVVRVSTQPGFVCRIDGLPAPADDACVRTPPSSAYWAFWTAQRGGSWRYSALGIDSYRPPVGSVIGFAFGPGVRPAVAPPPAVPATGHATTGDGGAPTAAAGGGTPGGGGSTGGPTAQTGQTGGGSPAATARTGPVTATGSVGAAPDGRRSGGPSTPTGSGPASATPAPGGPSDRTTTRAGPATADASPSTAPTAAGRSTGAGTAGLAGLAVILVVAGGAAWTARKRRRGPSR